MKIRSGFVSNSSSSSFILFKVYLSKEQKENIRNWRRYVVSDEYKKRLLEYSKSNSVAPHEEITFGDINESNKEISAKPFSCDDYSYYLNSWSVEETENTFDFDAMLDNFDMEQFLNVIGVDVDKCGLRLSEAGGHRWVVGLNDAKTDLKDYFLDDHYFNNYNDYWFTSKLYKDKIHPKIKGVEDDIIEPIEKKEWIYKDVGKALNEVSGEIYELAFKKGYSKDLIDLAAPEWKEVFLLKEILNIVAEVKNNWKISKAEENISST